MSIYSLEGRLIRGEGVMGVARESGSNQYRKVRVTFGKLWGEDAGMTVVELDRDAAVELMMALQRLFR